MLYLTRGGDGPRQRLLTIYRGADGRRGGLQVRNGASLRLLAAMAEPGLPPAGRHRLRGSVSTPVRFSAFETRFVESDARYFRRRSAEERQAAAIAAGPEAREAHEELAKRYERLSRQMEPLPVFQAGNRPRRHRRRPGASAVPLNAAPARMNFSDQGERR